MTLVSLARRTALTTAGLALALAPTLVGCGTAAQNPPITTTTTTAATTATPPPPGSITITTTPQPSRPSDPSAVASGTAQDRRARYLDALREAGVPVSQSGDAEVLIAEGVCLRLAAGISEDDLVRDVQGMGGVWTPENALAVVRSAGANYCTR